MMETLSPTGDLDELVLDSFQAELGAIDEAAELVLDFSAVTFCGSGCMRVLIETANRLRKGGGSLQIRHAQKIVRRAFAVGAVEFLLATDDDESEPDD